MPGCIESGEGIPTLDSRSDHAPDVRSLTGGNLDADSCEEADERGARQKVRKKPQP